MDDAAAVRSINSLRECIQWVWEKENARVNPQDNWYRAISMQRLRVLDRCSQAACDLGMNYWPVRQMCKAVMGWA
jgi:hypothetical protein